MAGLEYGDVVHTYTRQLGESEWAFCYRAMLHLSRMYSISGSKSSGIYCDPVDDDRGAINTLRGCNIHDVHSNIRHKYEIPIRDKTPTFPLWMPYLYALSLVASYPAYIWIIPHLNDILQKYFLISFKFKLMEMPYPPLYNSCFINVARGDFGLSELGHKLRGFIPEMDFRRYLEIDFYNMFLFISKMDVTRMRKALNLGSLADRIFFEYLRRTFVSRGSEFREAIKEDPILQTPLSSISNWSANFPVKKQKSSDDLMSTKDVPASFSRDMEIIPRLCPFSYLITSFRTGSSMAGMRANLEKALRTTTRCFVAAEEVLAATVNMLRLLGAYKRVQPYKNLAEMRKVVDEMNFEMHTAGGIHYAMDHEIKNTMGRVSEHLLEFVWKVNKGASHFEVRTLFLRLINRIERLLCRNHDKGIVYDYDWYPVLIAELGNKVEILTGANPDIKNRVFFIACFLKIMIQKALYAGIFKSFYCNKFVAIGHVWKHGGADRVARQVHADHKDWKYFNLDFSGLDQSLKPALLTWVGCVMILCLDFTVHDASDEFSMKLTRDMIISLMAWLADDTASTFVKWIGDSVRLVIGVLFSGEFPTSMFDTWCVAMALMVCHFRLERFVSPSMKGKYREWLAEFPFIIYGDDTNWGMPQDLVDHFKDNGAGCTYLELLATEMKKCFDMDFKISETEEFDSIDTKIVGGFPAHGRGFKFLQHYFTYIGAPTANYLPFRSIDYVFSKVGVTHHNVADYKMWWPKFMSAIYECGPLNFHARAFLINALHCLRKSGYFTIDENLMALDYPPSILEQSYDGDLLQKIRRQGLSGEEVHSGVIPPARDVVRFFMAFGREMDMAYGKYVGAAYSQRAGANDKLNEHDLDSYVP